MPNQTVKYNIRINKTKNRDIIVGFCSDAGLGNSNFMQAEFAHRNCHTGWIYEGGTVTGYGLPGSVVDDLITCEANLTSGVLRWQVNGSPLYVCAVPPKMKEKTLYLSIIMMHDGDEVEVSF